MMNSRILLTVIAVFACIYSKQDLLYADEPAYPVKVYNNTSQKVEVAPLYCIDKDGRKRTDMGSWFVESKSNSFLKIDGKDIMVRDFIYILRTPFGETPYDWKKFGPGNQWSAAGPIRDGDSTFLRITINDGRIARQAE